MSGDVQPRKRKDKKKRKDEDPYGSNEDITIHIHKDGGTGGNICAKIVFFILFSALIVLIGLIIKENQGLNELESIEAESRFSQIFEGWIDKAPNDHDDHDDVHSPELQEDEEHDHLDSEEAEEEIEEESEEPTEEDEEEEEEETEEIDDSVDRSEDDDEITQSEEEDRVVSEEDTEQDGSETDEVSDIKEEEDESEDKDDAPEDEESEEKVKSEEKEEDQVIDESKEKDDVDDHQIDAVEEINQVEEKNAEDAAAPKSESEIPDEVKSIPEEESTKENSGMATKIGVGLALLVVAYNVFLRKRRSDIVVEKATIAKTSEEKKEPTPDLSRRNTIVPPPTLQEVEPDLPEIDVESEEYSDEEYTDEDNVNDSRIARENYQELRATYSRSLTPEGNVDPKQKNYEDEEGIEEELEEEELEEEEEIEDDYDKYIEDEDEELLKRLEAKYGKLNREVNVEAESDSDREEYEHSDITNKEDYAIKESIDAAHEQLNKEP